jgi:hypothetical protein
MRLTILPIRISHKPRRVGALVFGAFAVIATLIPVRSTASSSTNCSKNVTRTVGLTPGSPTQLTGDLAGLIPRYVVNTPLEGRHCLVDLWMVPDDGYWTARYAVLIDAKGSYIVNSKQIVLWSAAEPHDWPVSLYKSDGRSLDTTARRELTWFFCFGTGVPVVQTKRLYQRVAGSPLPLCQFD